MCLHTDYIQTRMGGEVCNGHSASDIARPRSGKGPRVERASRGRGRETRGGEGIKRERREGKATPGRPSRPRSGRHSCPLIFAPAPLIPAAVVVRISVADFSLQEISGSSLPRFDFPEIARFQEPVRFLDHTSLPLRDMK